MDVLCASRSLPTWLVAGVGLAVWLSGGTSRADETPSRAASGRAEKTPSREASTRASEIRSGLKRLRRHDRQSRTLEAASGVVGGIILLGYGSYEYASSPNTWVTQITSWALVTSGATALGSAFYQASSPHPGAEYADDLLGVDSLSAPAALAYLHYRSHRARRNRLMGAIGALAGGVASGGSLAVIALSESPDEGELGTIGRDIGMITVGVTAAGLVAGGVYSLASERTEETIYRSVATGNSSSNPSATNRSGGLEVSGTPTLVRAPGQRRTMPGVRLSIRWW